MAATQAVLGANSVLYVSDMAGSPTYNEVPEALNIGSIGEQAELVDVTSLNSPNATREYIAGLKDGDERELTMNRIAGNAIQNQLLADAQAGNTIDFRVIFSNSEQADFSLVLLGWRIVEPVNNEQLRASINVKQTGATVWS